MEKVMLYLDEVDLKRLDRLSGSAKGGAGVRSRLVRYAIRELLKRANAGKEADILLKALRSENQLKESEVIKR